MKFIHPYLLLILSISSFAQAETWTSTDGRSLEGKFIEYDYADSTITIQRESDGQYVEIPENQLSQNDRLKAVQLENQEVQPYWYTDYETTKAENPERYCLFFYRNGSDPDVFQLFCYKLLLREEFVKKLDYRFIVVCIQEDLPEELFTTDWAYTIKSGEKTSPPKTAPPPGTPYLIRIDFHQIIDPNATFGPNYYDLTVIPGSRAKGSADPFQEASLSERELIPLSEIDKLVQKVPRDTFRK